MKETTYDRQAVPHLLDLLIHSQSDVRWCQRAFCINQQQQGISEIIIYVEHYRKVRGTLVYNTHTGKVITLRYRSHNQPLATSDDVVDALLDLINLEKSYEPVLT